MTTNMAVDNDLESQLASPGVHHNMPCLPFNIRPERRKEPVESDDRSCSLNEPPSKQLSSCSLNGDYTFTSCEDNTIAEENSSSCGETAYNISNASISHMPSSMGSGYTDMHYTSCEDNNDSNTPSSVWMGARQNASAAFKRQRFANRVNSCDDNIALPLWGSGIRRSCDSDEETVCIRIVPNDSVCSRADNRRRISADTKCRSVANRLGNSQVEMPKVREEDGTRAIRGEKRVVGGVMAAGVVGDVGGGAATWGHVRPGMGPVGSGPGGGSQPRGRVGLGFGAPVHPVRWDMPLVGVSSQPGMVSQPGICVRPGIGQGIGYNYGLAPGQSSGPAHSAWPGEHGGQVGWVGQGGSAGQGMCVGQGMNAGQGAGFGVIPNPLPGPAGWVGPRQEQGPRMGIVLAPVAPGGIGICGPQRICTPGTQSNCGARPKQPTIVQSQPMEGMLAAPVRHPVPVTAQIKPPLTTPPPDPTAAFAPFFNYQAKILSPSVRRFISNHMNQEETVGLSDAGYQKNWQGLAECMSMDVQYTLALERSRDPTKDLLMDWQMKAGSTIECLIGYFKLLDRYDILADPKFKELIRRCVEQVKMEAKQIEKEHAEEVQKRTEMKPADPKYTIGDEDTEEGEREQFDAFICFAPEDSRLIHDELLPTLEGKMKLKLCLIARDLLVGVNELVVSAELVKRRCRKTVVVLSKAFCREDSDMFQLAVAISLSLDPAARLSKIIPIRINQCSAPTSLLHICPVDFTRCRNRDWQWRKVCRSIETCEWVRRSFSGDWGLLSKAVNYAMVNSLSGNDITLEDCVSVSAAVMPESDSAIGATSVLPADRLNFPSPTTDEVNKQKEKRRKIKMKYWWSKSK